MGQVQYMKSSRLNHSPSKVTPKAKFPAGQAKRMAEPFQIEMGIPN